MAKKYVIETHVEAPVTIEKRGRPATYPFADMTVGSSIKVGVLDATRATNAAHKYGERHGFTFVTRKEGRGRRIWRVA